MLNTEILRDDITAAGSTDFSFDFPIYDETHILVINDGTVAVLNTDYTVRSGAGLFSALTPAALPAIGFVRFTIAPAVGKIISLIPLQPITQLSDYTTEGFPSGRIEKDFDTRTMLARVIKEQLRRGLFFDQKSLKQNVMVDDPINDYFLKFNGAGTRVVGASGIATLGAVVVPITVTNGGLGANNSAVARGSIPVFTAAGVVGFITIGAKGAIFVSDGVDVQKLSVGANGLALIADSTQATGVKWGVVLTTGDNTFNGLQQFSKGTDIASAAALSPLVGGNFFTVTGSVGITSIATVQAGVIITLRFTGTPLITHNAVSLILQGGVNLQIVAGDIIQFLSLGGGNWAQLTPVMAVVNRIVGTNVTLLGQLREDISSTGRHVLPVGTGKWAT